jgi:amino acid transporter
VPSDTAGSRVGAPPLSDEEVLSEFGYTQELNRSLSAFDLFGLSFSTSSITTGVFLMVGPTLAIAGTFGMWLVLLVGPPTLAIVFTYAALSRRMPIAGQEYQWGRRIFNRIAGVAAGWPGFIWALVAVVAVAYVLASSVLPALFAYTSSATESTWIAVLVALIVATLLIVSVKLSASITRYGAISEIVVIGGLTILLLLVGAIRGHLSGGSLLFTHHGISSHRYFDPFGWKSVGAFWMALTVVFFSSATTGWQNAGVAAEEGPNPGRNVPRAMYTCVIVVTLLQMSFLVALVLTIQPSHLAALTQSPTAIGDIVRGTLGTVVEKGFLALIAFNIVTCAIACFLQATRYAFAMARDGNFPGHRTLGFASVHPRLKTPVNVTLLCAAVIVGSLIFFGPKPTALNNMIGAGSLTAVFVYLGGVTLYAAGGYRLPLKVAVVERVSPLGRWILVTISYVWLLFCLWLFHESSFKDVWLYLAAMFGVGVVFVLGVAIFGRGQEPAVDAAAATPE